MTNDWEQVRQGAGIAFIAGIVTLCIAVVAGASELLWATAICFAYAALIELISSE
jgi:hypothetical protein